MTTETTCLNKDIVEPSDAYECKTAEEYKRKVSEKEALVTRNKKAIQAAMKREHKFLEKCSTCHYAYTSSEEDSCLYCRHFETFACFSNPDFFIAASKRNHYMFDKQFQFPCTQAIEINDVDEEGVCCFYDT